MKLAIIRRNIWIAVVGVGVTFLIAGLVLVNEGMDTKTLVRDRLAAEQIITGNDAAVPNALVQDVATAEAQEALITEHTLGNLGPFSALERGSAERDTYITGVTLRTALNLAVMGFKIADLVVALGVFIAVAGLANIFLLAPLAYMVGHEAKDDGAADELLGTNVTQLPHAA